MSDSKIRPRDRDAILQSLAAGVVPRRGLQYVQVGRADEIAALLRDVDRIADGGSAIRFIIGEYGSGKTFFLHLIRTAALEKNVVTMHADLNPDRRLHASEGQARNLYAELARNLATRTNPEGGALASVIERFVSSAMQTARQENVSVDDIIRQRLAQLSELVGGFDFAHVIAAYWRGHEEGLPDLQACAVRWLRAEYTTRTEARQDLGVRTIVDDNNLYDQIKLLARFVVLAGYRGLLVGLDELVNLYKLSNTRARTGNYEQILRILNDCLQGGVGHLGFIFAGTPEFLTDTRRGLFSYEALRSRLEESRFADAGLKDFSGPVVRLPSLTQEELFVLLEKLRALYPTSDGVPLIPDAGLHAFMQHAAKRLGEMYFRTPRTTIRSFVQLMAVLEQNPGTSWQSLLGGVEIVPDGDSPPALATESDEDDELASFKL